MSPVTPDKIPEPSEEAVLQGEGGACFPLLRALRQELSRGHSASCLWACPRQRGCPGCGRGDFRTNRGAGPGRVAGRLARGIGLEDVPARSGAACDDPKSEW